MESASTATGAIKQLAKELKFLSKNPPHEDISVVVKDENLSEICADIKGPPATPYEGGVFRVKLVITEDYPHTPPKGYFVTKIFHPNISSSGEICVNALKKDWNPRLGVGHLLQVVRCLLVEPNPDSALNPEAAHLLMECYEKYAKRAELYTVLYSIKRKAETNMDATTSTTATGSTEPPSNSTIHNVSDKNVNPSLKKPKVVKDDRKKMLKRL